jgi:hypothetical protein
MSRTFLLLIVLVLGVLAFGRRTAPGVEASAAIAAPPAAGQSAPVPTAPVARPPASTAPTAPTVVPAADPGSGSRTPTLDRLARLETKRRLAQAASVAFVDSLVPPDSVIRRWEDRDRRPITVAFVAPDRPNAARLVAQAWAAAREWERLGLGLEFAEAKDTSAAEIVVHWIDQFETERSGQADTQMNSGGAIVSAHITLALKDRSGRVLNDAELGAIATHEFGHALGLPHSDRKADIMFPVTTVPHPSDRDRATATLLYSIPPGPIGEPRS